MAVGSAALLSVVGFDMLAIFEVYQCPELRIGAKNYMSSPASITSVRSAFGNVFGPVKVH